MKARMIKPAVAALLAVSPAGAQTLLATCGASSGWSYYIEGGPVSKAQAGWQKDGIRNGQLIFLMRNDGVDIVARDAVQSFSARDDGAEVMVLSETPSRMVLIAFYPTTRLLEHFLLSFKDETRGEVVWGTIRSKKGQPTTSRLFRADCRR